MTNTVDKGAKTRKENQFNDAQLAELERQIRLSVEERQTAMQSQYEHLVAEKDAEINALKSQRRLEEAQIENEIAKRYQQEIKQLKDKYNDLYNREVGSKVQWTAEGERVMKLMNQPSPSCAKCLSHNSCGIWRGVGNVLNQLGYNEQYKPFKLSSLAKYCEFYKLDPEKDDNVNKQQQQNQTGVEMANGVR